MRNLFVLILLLSGSLAAQSATPAPISAPRVGTIDFYGRYKVSEDALRKALGFTEGQPLPRSKGDVEEALEQVKGVVAARLEATCCGDDGKAIVYIGLEERGAPHFDYNAPPIGEARLSDEIHSEYSAFLAAVQQAIRAGEVSEHLAEGHSFMANPGAYAHQKRFLELARDHLQLLRDVLRESGSEEHRAIAAYIIGYAPRKSEVVNDLQVALRDPDDTVRNNAMRALGAIAVLAANDPAQGIRVSPTWFIEALESLVWQDKTTSAAALVTLTESRPANVLDHLRGQSIPTLATMARWKHLPHALPAFILLGRIHGVPEEALQKAWSDGNRDAFLDGLLKPAGAPAGKKKKVKP